MTPRKPTTVDKLDSGTKRTHGGKRPGSGRKKGVPNRVTASMRQAWMNAFDKLGGVDALVTWGESNPDDFYKAVTKLIPQDVTSGGEKIAATQTIQIGDRTIAF